MLIAHHIARVARMRVLLLLFALVCASARDTNEATCPPARFLACGVEPVDGACRSAVTNDDGDRMCCWVVDSNGTATPHTWVTSYFNSPPGFVGWLPAQFGVADVEPIMNATFSLVTRVMTQLECYYYITDQCGALGSDGPVHALTVAATNPARFLVSEAVERYTQRETTANPDEFVCDCERKDGLPLPERYRCCYWTSGEPGPTDQDASGLLRTTSCRAPSARVSALTDCKRTVRPVSNCGDAGACYCRFEYAQASAGVMRDPWACGQCCPRLTGDFGHDEVARNNNTRPACLTDIFPFQPAPDGDCTTKLLPVRVIAQQPSAGSALSPPEFFVALMMPVFLVLAGVAVAR